MKTSFTGCLLIVFFMAILQSGCRKEKDTSAPDQNGTWQLTGLNQVFYDKVSSNRMDTSVYDMQNGILYYSRNGVPQNTYSLYLLMHVVADSFAVVSQTSGLIGGQPSLNEYYGKWRVTNGDAAKILLPGLQQSVLFNQVGYYSEIPYITVETLTDQQLVLHYHCVLALDIFYHEVDCRLTFLRQQ